MIVGFISKGAGILVLPVVLLPIFACVTLTSLLFPDSPSSHHLWPPGVGFLVSAVVLYLLNRHLKQGPRPTPRPSISDEYVKYARKPTIDAANSKVRSTHRFSAENDTGWFMFIPTGIWPFIIGPLGIFLIVGDVVESITTHGNQKVTSPGK